MLSAADSFFSVFGMNEAKFSGPTFPRSPTMSHHSSKLSAVSASSNWETNCLSTSSKNWLLFCFRNSNRSSDQPLFAKTNHGLNSQSRNNLLPLSGFNKCPTFRPTHISPFLNLVAHFAASHISPLIILHISSSHVLPLIN